MKQYLLEFVKRGLLVMGLGPIVLAIVYISLGSADVITSLSVTEVVRGILTVSLMAFIAAGITVVYQIEELPLLYAMLLHGMVLYLDYIMLYLINGWLADGPAPFLIFTACYILGYALVWLIIYLILRRKTAELNRRIVRGK